MALWLEPPPVQNAITKLELRVGLVAGGRCETGTGQLKNELFFMVFEIPEIKFLYYLE